MKTMMKRTFLGTLMLASLSAIMMSTDGYAATTQVDCSSSSAVQTALNNAGSGDTVQCNATGTYTWRTVTLPSDRNITLDLNGSTVLGGGSVVLNIPNSASYTARVTNFTIHSVNAINTGTGITNKPWRIDHCTINGIGLGTGYMITTWSGPGLIDHCTFNVESFMETIHNMGYGPSNLTGWQDPPAPGSMNALYIEDCTVNGQYGNGTCLIQSYYGARAVVRHNILNTIDVDYHGNHTAYGSRWWELYNNTVTGTNSTFCLRGGSGMVFNNSGSGSYMVFIDEPADAFGDPSNYAGVGHGQNNSYSPAYIWNNTEFSTLYNQDWCSINDGSGVRVGTDVIQSSSGTSLPATCTANPPQAYWRTDTNTLYKCTATNTWTIYYKPLTYPHPLQNAVTTNTTIPSPPTSLTVK